LREVTIRIENMHCGACVRRVSQALEKIGGVQVDEVRIGAARMRTPDDLPDRAVIGAVEKAGYAAVLER
jgi:copper chaperone